MLEPTQHSTFEVIVDGPRVIIHYHSREKDRLVTMIVDHASAEKFKEHIDLMIASDTYKKAIVDMIPWVVSIENTHTYRDDALVYILEIKSINPSWKKFTDRVTAPDLAQLLRKLLKVMRGEDPRDAYFPNPKEHPNVVLFDEAT